MIIDSPPVQPVSDTLILTQAADYNFFIIRSDSSKTMAFMSSMKKVKNVGAKIDGIIINDWIHQKIVIITITIITITTHLAITTKHN